MAITITEENRMESFLQRPVKRQVQILEILGSRKMTARQIAKELGFVDLNAVKPRLTELMHSGKVEVCGKVFDDNTGRNTSQYRRVE